MPQLETLFSENDLVINVEKTKVMFFQYTNLSKNIRHRIVLNNNELNCTANLKFLGININEG